MVRHNGYILGECQMSNDQITGTFAFDNITGELVFKLDNMDGRENSKHQQGLVVAIKHDKAEGCQLDAGGNPIEGFAKLWLIFNKEGVLCRAYEL